MVEKTEKMKLSIISSDYSEDTIERNLRNLRFYGYEGIELALRDTQKIKIGVLEKLLRKYKLEVSALGTGLAYFQDKLSLSSLNQGVRKSAISRVKRHIQAARILNTPVIIGLIRGKLNLDREKKIWKEGYANLKSSLLVLAEYAQKRNVSLLIEPINRYETSFLHNLDEALLFLKQIRGFELGLLLDSFHMNIEEENLSQAILRADKLLKHVHLADNNRRCPGEGHLDFKKIITALKKNKYSGYLSAEVSGVKDFSENCKNYFKNIKKLL